MGRGDKFPVGGCPTTMLAAAAAIVAVATCRSDGGSFKRAGD